MCAYIFCNRSNGGFSLITWTNIHALTNEDVHRCTRIQTHTYTKLGDFF